MNVFRITSLILGLALLVSACNRGTDEAETDAVPAETDTQGRGEMGDMPGMGGMGGGMMNQMMNHMQAMHGAGADSMKAMLPMHRQMVANMIAQMNKEMRDMNMTTDAQWNATVDSLREDLKRMPEMSAQEMHAFMPAHRNRMMRLMDMHRTMMKNMNM